MKLTPVSGEREVLKPKKPEAAFVDPDDAPEWTDDQLDRAEFAIDGKVIRPAQGTLTKQVEMASNPTDDPASLE